jgi:RNA polymerase sigma-70 factor (ECF subfamily)
MRTQPEDFAAISKAAADAATGDRRALAYLYGRYAGCLRSYARRIVHDDHEAEDVAHEVFLKLIKSPSKYDPSRASFTSWILSVTHNTAIDHLRRRRELVVNSPFGTSPEPRAAEPEVGRALRSAIATLSESQQLVLVMREVVGLTPSEIAARLESNNGAVNTLYHRARVAAREALVAADSRPVTLAGTAA